MRFFWLLAAIAAWVCVCAAAPAGLSAAPADDVLFPGGSLASGAASVSFNSTDNDYVFRFVGGETVEYRIDLDDPAVQQGVLRIYEMVNDVYPVYYGGALISNSGGTALFPENGANTGVLTDHSIARDTVTLSSSDTVQGITVTKNIEITLAGKSLKIHAYTTDSRTSFFNNHAGFTWGHSENAPNAERIIIPYMETMGTTMVDDLFFYQTFIDYTQSNCSRAIKMAEPAAYVAGSSTKFLNSIYTKYSQLSDNTVNPLNETGWVTVTSSAGDMFVRGNNPASPYRAGLDDAAAWNFSSISTSTDFVRYTDWLNAFSSYGMRNFNIYVWGPWAYGQGNSWPTALPPSGVGGTEAQLQTMIDTAKSLGHRIGLYTYYFVVNTGSPDYDPNDANHTRTGAIKDGPWGPNGKLCGSDAALANNQWVEQGIQDRLGINLAYEDTLSMQFPDGGLLSEYKPDGHPSTLRQSIINYKTMFLQSKGIHDGPYFGEGALAPAYVNVSFDAMYKGYVDGWERHMGDWAGGGTEPTNNSDYFVIPDFELSVVKPYAVGLAFGFPQRFIAAGYPHSDPVHDEVLATLISYGHIYYYTTNGRLNVSGGGEYALVQSHIKGYYMTCVDLQEQYMSSNVLSIGYWDGASFLSLSDAYRAGLDLTIPKLLITYDNGLVIWVNHAPTDWSIVASGAHFTIPENGWVARNTSERFLEFSAIPQGYPSRFDYVRSRKRGFEMIDGRGTETTYGGITGTDLRIEWYNGFTVTETGRGIDVVGERPQADPNSAVNASWSVYR